MIPYILHVSLIIAICYVVYILLLERETFFKANRWLLVGTVVLAFSLPSITIPSSWSFQEETPKKVYVKPNIVVPESEKWGEESVPNEVVEVPELEIEEDQAEASPMTGFSISLQMVSKILLYIYIAGVLVLTLNLLVQLFYLVSQVITRPSIKDGPFKIVELKKDKSPFSFWNNIFINPAKYDWETYNQILQHEKIHIRQRHTLDILLAELLVIVQWFNPFAWLYRKAIENNLEYLTDEEMLKSGVDRKSYQMNLLKVSVPDFPLSPATNYNQSILKKRVIMMNARKSSLSSTWKYLILFPLLGLTVVLLNPVHTIANNNFKQSWSTSQTEDMNPTIPKGEVRVDPVIIDIDALPIDVKGEWSANIKGNEVCMDLNGPGEEGWHQWHRTSCFAKSALSKIPQNQEETFTISREAGILKLTGKFDGNKGWGKFEFDKSDAFVNYLDGEGYSNVEEGVVFHLFMSNVDKAYLNFLKQNDIKPKSNSELEALAHHAIPLSEMKSFVSELKNVGFSDLVLEDLLKAMIHNVDAEYIKELRSLGFKDLEMDDIVQASIHNVDGGFIKEMRALGFEAKDMDEIVQAAIHNVDTDFVKEIQALGFKDMEMEEIVQASIHNVNAAYIKEMRALGFEAKDIEDIVQASIHNVNAAYIKEMRAAGFQDMEMEELVQASIHNVNAAYIKEMRALGFKNMDMEDIVQASIHNVRPAYIKEMRALGFEIDNMEEIVQASIHNVNAAYIKEMRAAGFQDMEMEEIVQASIHNVSPAYIKEMQALGIEGMELEEIIQASIHNVNAQMIKEMRDLGFKAKDMDEIVQISIHNVRPTFIKGLREMGLEDIDVDEIVAASIHGVTIDFIKQANKDLGVKNLRLEEYIELKIHNMDDRVIERIKNRE